MLNGFSPFERGLVKHPKVCPGHSQWQMDLRMCALPSTVEEGQGTKTCQVVGTLVPPDGHCSK